ncbi:MAG: alpha/beta hydrolase [Ferruginibacter sp.]|nr:alpha/beta hydrolase [Cytophagales bacterium]
MTTPSVKQIVRARGAARPLAQYVRSVAWLLLIFFTACEDHFEVKPPVEQTIKPAAPAGFRHANARVNGINLHYVIGGKGEAVVLLHGFPQTWYEWVRIMPQLGQRYTVIAPDLRGGGLSDKPAAQNGYDKKLLAEDIHQLVGQLGYSRVKLVGHDIGMMVAYAYAALYPNEVDRLVVMDAPLPGIEPVWSLIQEDPRAAHFSEFQVRGYENTLVGREREFLEEFYRKVGYRQTIPFTEAELDAFVTAYTGADNLRGGFEWYRGFPTDVADNQRFSQTKLTMPVLALGGDESAGPLMVAMMAGVAQNVTGGSVNGSVPQSGHWLVESQPEIVLRELLAFLDQ